MKTTKLKIAIFDDEEKTRSLFLKKVTTTVPQKQYEVVALKPTEFTNELEKIKDRQKCFRVEGSWEKTKSHSILDDVSILILDYDLFETYAFLKASEIAYLVRCFTTCGLIIVINEAGHNPFDLTLKGQLHSFADLHIGQDQLSSPFLWGVKQPKNNSRTPTEFYPWQWPDLLSYYQSFANRIKDVLSSHKHNLPIEDTLGFDKGTFNLMPRNISQFLGDNASNATFEAFIASENGLEFKDRQFKSDIHIEPSIVARVGAARIAKWLEYSVLSEQDILVDAPHLVFRLPGLLSGDPKTIATWNNVTSRGPTTKTGIKASLIKNYQFQKTYWVSRPLWFWRKIMEDKNIEQVREPWNIEYPKWVFCEDASAFSVERQEFVSKAQSSYSRRYIRYFDSVEYEPRNRLSL